MKIVLIILLVLLGLLACYGLTLLIAALLVDKNKIYNKHNRFYRILLNSATFVVKTACNIRFKISGLEKMPEGRYVMICNHRSGFDPLMTYFMFRKDDMAFLSKPENFNIPIFGKIIRRCCFLPIDREDPKKAMKSLLQAAEYIKDDQVSIGVYPEGTRSRDGKLLPFHSGVIKIAQKAKVPMVVAAIRNSDKVKGRAPLKKTVICLDILKVYDAEEVCTKRSTELGDEAFNIINSFLEENNEG